jgi:hypothetical protein
MRWVCQLDREVGRLVAIDIAFDDLARCIPEGVQFAGT